MKKNINLIMTIILYVTLFVSAFFMISYFTNFIIFDNTIIQLYLAISTLIIAMALIFIMIRKTDHLKLIEKIEVKEEQIGLNQSNQFVTEPTEPTEKIELKKEEQDDIKPSNQSFSEPIELKEKSEEIVVRKPDIKINAAAVEEGFQKIVSSDKRDDEEINLSKTQLSYIEKSHNSYINENGMPQLVMTTQLNAPRKFNDIKPKETIVETRSKKYEEVSDEDLYLQDEMHDSLVSKLTIAIIVLVIMNLIVGGYYIYSRFIG